MIFQAENVEWAAKESNEMQTFPACPTFQLLFSSNVWHVTVKTEFL